MELKAAKPRRAGAKRAPQRSLAALMDLSGRRVLIAGGAGHVGQAAAEAVAELGASVAVLDLQAAAGASKSRQAMTVPCDLRNEAATRKAARTAVQRLGGLDVLIHSAAAVPATPMAGWAVPFPQQTIEAWDEALRVNLTSALVLAQEGQEALQRSGHGSVILISSIYGLVGPDHRLYEGTGMANPAAYGASKGGLLQLMRHLATTLAPRVRVNAISPGGLWRAQPEAFQRRYCERTPLGRLGTEEDLKGAVAFLASELSAYVTGHNLVVDGGWTTW